jgi:predicted DCC family thiol-disulfide oxidoreductase YuxK
LPLQDAEARRMTQLSEFELLEGITLVQRDGKVLRGPAVFREVMRLTWWLYPAYLLSIVPGLRGVFDGTYGWVVKNRQRLSGSCETPRPPHSSR